MVDIKICKSCSGDGKNNIDQTGRGDSQIEECVNCKGTGKIFKIRFYFELPYDITDELNVLDADIYKVWRNFEKNVKSEEYQRERTINSIL